MPALGLNQTAVVDVRQQRKLSVRRRHQYFRLLMIDRSAARTQRPSEKIVEAAVARQLWFRRIAHIDPIFQRKGTDQRATEQRIAVAGKFSGKGR